MKFSSIQYNRLLYRLRHDYLTLNNVVVAVAFLVAAGWVWGSVEAMQRNYELQKSIDSKKHQIELETLRVSLLDYETKYYQSNEYLDLAVRRRLGRGLSGESQLIVASTDNKTAPSQTANTKSERTSSNLEQWMKFLFGDRR